MINRLAWSDPGWWAPGWWVFYADSLGWVSGSTVDRDHLNPLVVEADEWIGCNAVILPGCRQIGTGAVIGAGAIVTNDVPAFAIMAGNPARQLKWRFDAETRSRILATQWWLMDEADLMRCAPGVLAGNLEGPQRQTAAAASAQI